MERFRVTPGSRSLGLPVLELQVLDRNGVEGSHDSDGAHVSPARQPPNWLPAHPLTHQVDRTIRLSAIKRSIATIAV